MEKNHFLTLFISITALVSTILLVQGWLLITAVFLAVATIGFLRFRSSDILQLTRWAKAHPGKAQFLIAGLLLSLMGLGMIVGHNLHELGQEIPASLTYLFSILTITGFFFVPFLAKRRVVAIPKVVNRHRLVYLGISLFSFLMMIGVGNRAVVEQPESQMAQALLAVDQSLFPLESSEEIDLQETAPRLWNSPTQPYSRAFNQESSSLPVIPVGQVSKEGAGNSLNVSEVPRDKKSLKRAKKKQRKVRRKLLRSLLGGGSCALAVLLIILLVATTCGGICLVVLGISAITNGSVAGGVLAVLLGPLVVWGSILGIIKAGKWCKGDNGGSSNSNNG
ncbi:MAG: hypothetical protein AAF587_07460 [Bacteroidota bacterium]